MSGKDALNPHQRSLLMARVKHENTKPEVELRRLLHRRGFRFRINVRALPGTPDIVLPKYRSCIFVHGCFWHRHPGCQRASNPTKNAEFWQRSPRETVSETAKTSDCWRNWDGKQSSYGNARCWKNRAKSYAPSKLF